MRKIELEDLYWLKRVVELGSIHRAASELGKSQPGLSKAIRRLEVTLGLTLFERTSKGVLPTEAGKVIYRRALELSDWSRGLEGDIQSFKGKGTRTIRIGVVPALLQTAVIPIIHQMLSEQNVTLSIRSQLSDSLLQLLQAGEVDCIISAFSENLSDEFNHLSLGTRKGYVVCRQGHPILKSKPTALALSQHAWVMSPKHIISRQWIDAYFESELNFKIKPTVEIDGTPAILVQLLESTDLLTTLTEDALQSSTCKTLVALPPPAPAWEVHLALLWRRSTPFTETMEIFRNLAVNRIKLSDKTKITNLSHS